MKQYSFLQEALISDFYKATIGQFRHLFSSNTASEAMLKLRMKGFKPIYFSPKKTEGFNGQLLKLKDTIHGIQKRSALDSWKQVRPLSDSNEIAGSVYYISRDGKKLARISDHWSDSNITGVKTCGPIKSCWWRLVGRQGNSTNKKYQVGIIDLKKLSNSPLNDRQFFGDTLVKGKII